jgi:hypothetical protein
MSNCIAPFCELPKYIHNNKSHGYCRYHLNERARYKVKSYKELLPLWAFKRCKVHGLLNYDHVYTHKIKNKNHFLCKRCTKSYVNSLYCPIKAKVIYQKRKQYKKDRELKCLYGINLKDYQSKLISQNHSCAICNIPLEEYLSQINKNRKCKRTTFNIDHCHKTKNVRGLLCHKCNTLLGMAKDSIIILNEAIVYLRKHGHE